MFPEMEANREADQYEQLTNWMLQCTTRAITGNNTTAMEAPMCNPVRNSRTVRNMRKVL